MNLHFEVLNLCVKLYYRVNKPFPLLYQVLFLPILVLDIKFLSKYLYGLKYEIELLTKKIS